MYSSRYLVVIDMATACVKKYVCGYLSTYPCLYVHIYIHIYLAVQWQAAYAGRYKEKTDRPAMIYGTHFSTHAHIQRDLLRDLSISFRLSVLSSFFFLHPFFFLFSFPREESALSIDEDLLKRERRRLDLHSQQVQRASVYQLLLASLSLSLSLEKRRLDEDIYGLLSFFYEDVFVLVYIHRSLYLSQVIREKCVGFVMGEARTSYTPRDAILYALGVGCSKVRKENFP